MQAEFLLDVASPNAYMAYKVLPEIEKRHSVSFTQVPVLLGGIFKSTNNVSPMVAYANIPSKLAYEQQEIKRFVEKYALPFVFNPHFPLNSLQMMRVATATWLDGDMRAYLDVVMRHMWEEPKKLDDPAILQAVLDEAGLDGAGLLARSQRQDVKDALIKNTQDAVARGAFGLPTFFVNGTMFFGKDRLRDVEDELQRTPRR